MAKKTLPGAPPDEFLRISTVAEELGTSRGTVYRLIDEKRALRAVPLYPGGPYRVARSELERYKAARFAEGSKQTA